MFEDKHQEGYRFVELDHFTIDERMDHWPLSAVAENFGEEHGVVFVNINDLVFRELLNCRVFSNPHRLLI